MRITTVLGGVVSLAVIVAMAGIYNTAYEAQAAVNPSEAEITQGPAVDTFTQALRFDIEPSTAGTRAALRWDIGYETAAIATTELDEKERHCLAQNIYFEARGESEIGQRAVAWVTLNRVADSRWPNTICGVVWQRVGGVAQFSWTNDGLSDTPRDADAWARAQAVADAAWTRSQQDPTVDPTNGAIAFVVSGVHSSWHASLDRVVQIDSHVFYR
jgi:N-acetylmuramoyl-L-alanine amidase